MKYRILFAVMTATVLQFSAGLSSATENKTDTPQPAATKAETGPKSAKHKHSVKLKLVDINSATKDELKKLPGISDAEADKIISSRPFGSKAWLVTNKIISTDTYHAISGLIVCKLTKKEVDQIEAQYQQQNKKK